MKKDASQDFKKAVDKAFTSQPNVKLNSSTMKDALNLKQQFKEEELIGGKGDKMTLKKLAKKHGVSLLNITSQFDMGVEVEREHTNDLKKSIEIALDHLTEDPKYYSKLSKIETKEGPQTPSRRAFTQDLQKDKDYIEFKKRAKYKDDRGVEFSFGIPNVTSDDPFISKKKWSRPGKEETKEATGSGSSGAFTGPIAFKDSEFLRNSFKETPRLETKESVEVELSPNEKEMVNGIVDIVKQVKNIGNRESIANDMIQKFKREKIKFDYDKFLKMCGLKKEKKIEEQIEKVETKEATGSGSVGGYESPSMWAKSTKKKDWGPSRKTQYKGGSFVKVKKKCTKFPYCNQGDINALILSKNESVKEAIKSISTKYNISENFIISILENEYSKLNKRGK